MSPPSTCANANSVGLRCTYINTGLVNRGIMSVLQRRIMSVSTYHQSYLIIPRPTACAPRKEQLTTKLTRKPQTAVLSMPLSQPFALARSSHVQKRQAQVREPQWSLWAAPQFLKSWQLPTGETALPSGLGGCCGLKQPHLYPDSASGREGRRG